MWHAARAAARGSAVYCGVSQKMTGLFCKSALQKRLCSAKETFNLKEPTNRSHPIMVAAKMTGLFCKSALQKRLYSAKETFNLKEPASHSHLIIEAAKMTGLFCKRAL